jgi:hypothetical protein
MKNKEPGSKTREVVQMGDKARQEKKQRKDEF